MLLIWRSFLEYLFAHWFHAYALFRAGILVSPSRDDGMRKRPQDRAHDTRWYDVKPACHRRCLTFDEKLDMYMLHAGSESGQVNVHRPPSTISVY